MATAVVSSAEWLAARMELLKKEKEHTRRHDELCELRRRLPRVRVEKSYIFDGPDGKETLGDLFAGRSQLVVKHFMFGPGWKEGCVGCSFGSDHVDGMVVHLENRDVSLVVVSRAPLAEIRPFQRRMGWRFKWVSSFGSDFNYDFHVTSTPEEVAAGKSYYNYVEAALFSEEQSGLSVFHKDSSGTIFHTYSTYGRGDEAVLGTYAILDLTPNGRNETGPRHNLTDWVRHHDRYEAAGHVDGGGRFVAGAKPCCDGEGEAGRK
jgi:predicted dithiol-disulfide oxidoreductase (DUF899 family)